MPDLIEREKRLRWNRTTTVSHHSDNRFEAHKFWVAEIVSGKVGSYIIPFAGYDDFDDAKRGLRVCREVKKDVAYALIAMVRTFAPLNEA